MKKGCFYLLLCFCSFFAINIMKVQADITAQFSIVDRHDIYLENCDSSGNCSTSSNYTIYKKTVDGKTAYCMELNKTVPKGTCTRRDSWWRPNYRHALIAAQIIKIGKAQSGSNEWNKYLWIQEALNCNQPSDYTWSKACNSKMVKAIINEATTEYNKYKYTELSNTSTLPTPTFSGSKQLERKGTGKYLSSAITIKGLEKTYGGEDYETKKVSYTLTATSSKGTAYICDTATTNSNNFNTRTKTISNLTEKTFYILLTGAGDNGGNVSISLKGSNESSYPTTYYWDCGSDSQRMITEGDNITITRNVSKSYSLIYNESDKLTARVEKLDSNGENLEGAKLTLFTASDEDGVTNKKEICTINGTNSSCQDTTLLLDGSDGKGFTNGRYICYIETEAAPKYKLYSKKPLCQKINSNSSETIYYLTFEDGTVSEDQSDIDNYNNKALYCNATKYRDITSEYVNSVIDQGITDNPKLSLGECSDNISKATICIEHLTFMGNPGDVEENDIDRYRYDSTGNSCQSTTDSENNPIEPTGQNYCISKDTYKELERKPCGTDGLIGNSVCYNSSTNTSIDDKFCASGTNLTTITSNNGSYVFSVENSLNEVLISKKAITGTEELPGAILSLYTTNEVGECTETLATSEAFTYRQIADSKSTGIINYDNISQAMETLSNNYNPAKDGLRWISSYIPASIQGLETGTYCLQEEIAPMGYKKLTTVTKFKINEDGSVELIDNKSADYDESTNTISIHDELIKITISKQDMTTSKELPGATLSICGAVKNADGDYEMVKSNNGDCSVVTLSNGEAATWVSEETPHIIEGLGEGSYYLVEITSPDGYEEAESIFFTVDEQGNITDKNGTNIKDSKIIMKDKPKDNKKTGDAIMAVLMIIIIMSIGSMVYFKNEKESLV